MATEYLMTNEKTKQKIVFVPLFKIYTLTHYTHTPTHTHAQYEAKKKAQCQYIFIQITIGIHTISCVFFCLVSSITQQIYIYISIMMMMVIND